MKITGTFLDEISLDIPSANWGPQEWAKDFDAMKAVGIDTVILIRAGYMNKCTFESETIKKLHPILPVPTDLLEVFLSEADRCNMDFYFGTYDSEDYWRKGDYQKEIDINMAFADEVMEKYGHHKSFNGWYISNEVDTCNPSAVEVYKQLSKYLKSLKDAPVLISPYFHGVKMFDKYVGSGYYDARRANIRSHKESWKKVFEAIEGHIDIVAFQDGNVDYEDLEAYLEVNKELSREHDIQFWSNVETFDRDMPWKFPPIGFTKLLHKMMIAEKVGVDKMITFEFSHFMSPNSIYYDAHNLYKVYKQYFNC
ncbi:MAG: DUF4434 domain-containing protein [Sedimentisphaeraceae bacterium JB056]